MPLNDIRCVHLPYLLERQKDGRYVILNRERQPLGYRVRRFEEPYNNSILVTIKGLTKITATKISVDGNDNIDNIYLYDDGCIPTKSAKNMQEYMRRLYVLAKLKISDGED